MTGIVLWADSYNNDAIKKSDAYIQLEYAYVKASDVVTAESTYDWLFIESLLDDIEARGHQAILRWYYVYPGDQTSVPNYIKQLGDYSESIGSVEGMMTSFPDWTHTELERFHLEFFTQFADKYDDDPRIAFLQVGFGLWGEYHIYEGPNVIGEQFPSKAFQTNFFEHMDDQFDALQWSISIDAGDRYYSPLADSSNLRAITFGLFDDSFMHEEHDDYNEDMWNVFDHIQRFKTASHGGELSYYSDYDQRNVLNAEGIYGRTYEQLSEKFHITYMIGNDQPSYQSNARIRDAGMANGYKFRVTSFESRDGDSRVTIRNDGVAPIYYDAFVSINGVRASTSLKGLLPEESRDFVIAAGGTQPKLSIESDRLVSGQIIQFEADL